MEESNTDTNNELLLTRLEMKYEGLIKKKRELHRLLSDNEYEQKNLIQQIINIKEEIIMPQVIECVKKIDINNIISINEIKELCRGMDKSNYSDYGCDTFLDIDKLTRLVINEKLKLKEKNSDFEVSNVKLILSQDSYPRPPKNYYIITYKNSDNFILTKSY